MELRQLRYFIGIVDAGSMTRAAEVLCIAQPSLSAHIARMEEELEAALFDRLPRGIRPTEAGMVLYQRAQEILASVDQAVAELRTVSSSLSGKVHLGLTGTINGALAVPLMTAARDRFPLLQIVISEAMSGFVQDWAAGGRIDLGVIYGDRDLKGLASERLFVEELVALTAPDDPARSFGELAASRPFILPGQAHGLRQTIDNCLSRLGLSVDAAFEVASYQNIVDFTIAGFGASILPRHAVARELSEGRLRAVAFGDPPMTRVASIVTPTTKARSVQTMAVESLLKDVVADLVGAGGWHGVRLR
ncbi:LysR substrate-binding domain-containing protein [Salipiger sp. P9]|uniref:LysR family transcriptional regulator n=1 Tax=Salipiger pentaromativorans TaxID=2943193 RepID=UPI002157CF21|nr:LysR substrate-binding domain-containing protein [Salipiger pentaromativorans]MCR8551036.1 LysR substrate-binding domain-containing protein [Salipiger pentaromativorans]